jgi:hypothetical protein
MARPIKEQTRLPMPFGEALERYIKTNPSEMGRDLDKPKKKKPKVWKPKRKS